MKIDVAMLRQGLADYGKSQFTPLEEWFDDEVITAMLDEIDRLRAWTNDLATIVYTLAECSPVEPFSGDYGEYNNGDALLINDLIEQAKKITASYAAARDESEVT